MAFNELIKNFDHIRQMMRDFYVFGFKSRADFAEKAHAAMIMSAGVLKAGWASICIFGRMLAGRIASLLWIAERSNTILFIKH